MQQMIVHLNDDTADRTELKNAAMHISHAIPLVQCNIANGGARTHSIDTETELPPSLIGWREA